MHDVRSVRELSRWSANPTPDTFPYDAVIDDYHAVGKHFVSADLLEELDGIRTSVAEKPDPHAEWQLLTRFLGTALDKRDNRYDYPTYLALDLLPLPGPDCPDAQRQHDRLVIQLAADAIAFELAVRDGRTALFPELRPDPVLVAKRCRLALRAGRPAWDRLGLPRTDPPTKDAVRAARDMCAAVDADLSAGERRALRLSMLPVWVAHDEYLFIRILQTFETAFALLVVQLRTAVDAVARGDVSAAITAVEDAASALREDSRWFSLMATMQVQSFLLFRQYTEGASAIQSRNYKVVESLCRSPSQERLDSAAYRSVPEVRARLLAHPVNLDDVLRAAQNEGRLPPDGQDKLIAAMWRFESMMLQWRQTHYRLAVRMLGDRTGTGYTEGTPYLRDVRNEPVFRSTAEQATTAG